MVVARVAGPRSENWEGSATKEGGGLFYHLLIYLMPDISLGAQREISASISILLFWWLLSGRLP